MSNHDDNNTTTNPANKDLVEALLDQPTTEMIPIAIDDPDEYRKTVFDWNRTESIYPDNKTIHALFEEQVTRLPDHIALIDGEAQWSYKRLNAQANTMAHAIRAKYKHQVGQKIISDTLVGLYIESGSHAVISMLGILKAGAAYLPLDPSHPKDRIKAIIEDAGLKLIVTQAKFVPQLKALTDIAVFALEDIKPNQATTNPRNRNQSHDLCYVIYTSGSTGMPKGVMVEHKSVNRLVKGMNYIEIDSTDKMAQTAPMTFDAATFEVWGALLNGATLICTAPGLILEADRFAQYLQNNKISILWITVALFNELVLVNPAMFSQLKYLLTGGDQINPASVQRVFECKEGRPQHILNCYGPTENTTFSTTYLIQNPFVNIPIGSCISNTTGYILDDHLQALPIGVAGELYLGGDGIARGYLNRETLTQERFIANPFATKEEREKNKNLRLYKTGDLVRWGEDGNIEFLGRTDFQVKIRGFRIELPEIETVLAKFPLVGQCAVVVQEIAGQKEIVAYFTKAAHADNTVDQQQLRDYLSTSLPDYMIPAFFMEMTALPITLNGKVDRKALPIPSRKKGGDEAYVAPRNAQEKALVAIWEELLSLSPIGVTGNFFHLGGHSLKAMQLSIRIKEQFHVDYPVKVIFDHPTIEGLATLLQTNVLSEEISSNPIALVDREQDLVTSFAQQRLWFLEQLEANKALYHIPLVFRLTGQLSASALEQSLNALLLRHEALRTTFYSQQGVAYQRIHLAQPLHFVPIVTTQDALQDAITQQIYQPFDLQQGPLFRVNLYQLAEQEHVLSIVQHHIISDGWSVGVFIRELSALYEAALSNRAVEIPSLSIQYADFSAWQRQSLENGRFDAQLDYWKAQLDGFSALELPIDYKRPAQKTYTGKQYVRLLDAALFQRLKPFCENTQSSLFMVLLATFNVLLNRYSNQEDITIGIPTANRVRQELEPLMGFFVNTLVIRSRLENNLSFLDLLQQVKNTCLDAYSNQDIPFDQLVDVLQVERVPNRSPIFDVMFVLQNAGHNTKLMLPGLDVEAINTHDGVAKFDLVFAVEESENALSYMIEYNTDLYQEATIERMVEQYTCLLDAIVANPTMMITELPLLTQKEQTQLMVEWNATDMAFPTNKTFQQVFEAQVKKTPHHIAAVFEGEILTYQALNEKANQLAYALREQSLLHTKEPLKAGTPIGLCLNRGLGLLIGMLGIIKAGAAYLPLDPHYPAERLNYMLSDSNAPFVLAEPGTLTQIEPVLPRSARVLVLDELLDQRTQEQVLNNPVLLNQANDLAYIIYTSGSTGKPKGVMIEHHSLVNFVCGYKKIAKLTAKSRALGFSTINFDAAIIDFCVSLSAGAGIWIVPEAMRKDVNQLTDFIETNGVTHAILPPAVLSLMPKKALPDLAVLTTGGESCAKDVMDIWSAGRTLINAYGPTEGTVCATYSVYHSEKNHTQIGRFLPNVQGYVLDSHLQLTPIGVPGELYIGGEGLARGYLNQENLTAERFIANPFATAVEKVKGENPRLYKTGDLVRWLPEGELEFLGRTDSQVKIRGLRIELGEIETQLGQHPDIDQCVVMVQEQEGQKSIVAYFTAFVDQIEVSTLRQHVTQSLPDYMIPACFMQMEALPITANGKVDRKKLPLPDFTALNQETYIAAETQEEQMLVEIWQQLLNVQPISVNANFFHIGGHSLKATQLVSRVQEAFHLDCPVKAIFEYPTIKTLANFIREQSQEVALSAISIVNREGRLPLSYAQQRLWFIDQLEGATSTSNYNVPFMLRLKGALSVDALECAFRQLFVRHESLRTRFERDHAQAYQIILPSIDFTLAVDAIDPATLDATLEADMAKPFDLSQGPLIRVRLLKLSDQEHVLSIVQHHIISDGWSLGILVKELGMLYSAHIDNQAADLPVLPIQYVDFAQWQREHLENGLLEKQLQYWGKHLEGLATVELPTDFKRPAQKTQSGALYRMQWGPELNTQLKYLCQKTNTSMYMVLLAGLNVLLRCYSGQQDIVVGSPIAARTRKELENLMGFFVNTLVLRNQVPDQLSVTAFLAKVKQVALDAYANQDTPFERLVDFLQVEREASRSPIFDVMFAWQNTEHHVKPCLSHLETELMEPNSKMAKFDLSFFLEEIEGDMCCVVEYNTDLYKQDTIERMVGHFKKLLASMAANPEQTLADIDLLDQKEYQQLTVDWNQSQSAYPDNQTIHQLFEAQVEKTPEHIAVMVDEQKMTYRELNKKANQLAHLIRRQYHLTTGENLVADTPIGICFKSNVRTVIAMIAVLKAGGVYVPLDPSYPVERLKYMLSDTKIQLLLTESKILKDFSVFTAVNTLLFEQDLLSTEAEKQNLNNINQASDLCYIMYTSGSTGIPKGVMVEHKSVNRLVKNTNYIEITTQDRVLQAAPVSFDAATFEIWGALLNGACLVCIGSDILLDREQFARCLTEYQISILWLTAALFDQFVSTDPAMFSGLKYLLAGGDALNINTVRKLLTCPQGRPSSILNGYGPTENTTFTTTFNMDQLLPTSTSIPLGQYINNTIGYVLDAHLKPVPIGVPGELYVGGAGLARGYLNQAQLTQERFIANPFVSEIDQVQGKNLRLYKTGDLVRWLPEGKLEFLGRTDSQVKIRGFRIELGEIETQLGQHPAINQCVVVVQELANQKTIVAYFTLKDRMIDADVLRPYLLQKLPVYMVPACFVPMQNLPITANGKVDRRKLPLPDFATLNKKTYLAAASLKEQELVNIWEQLLGITPISVTANFFHIGGHSLKATQLASRIQEAFHIDCPVKVIFEYPTIRALAIFIESQAQSVALAMIPTVERVGNLPLSYAQQRLWFIDQLEGAATSANYNVPLIMRLQGKLSIDALQKSIATLIARHESLRTVFTCNEGEAHQVILPTLDMNVCVERALETELQSILQAETTRPFDLSQSPLIRVRLLQLSDQDHVLSIIQHHIISDGWSIGVLLQELSALYSTYVEEKEVSLAALPIQYADFSQWQRQWLASGVLDQQMAYWKQHLEGFTTLELQTDDKRPATKTYAGKHYSQALGKTLTAQLDELCLKTGSSLFMVLLAGFNVLLSHYTAQEDIVVGSPIANRTRQEFENLMGFFVNTLVLRNDLSGNPRYIDLLQRVKETCLAAYTHQDVPFEHLVEALQVERIANHSPIFDVMFVLQNAEHHPEVSLPGLCTERLEVDYDIAKFDLTVSLEVKEGELYCAVEYNTDLYQAATIERLVEHYDCLLHAIVANPDMTIDELPLLTQKEQSQLIVEWNATDTAFPTKKTFQQLFEAQVKKTPHHIAVVFEGEMLTYQALNQKANQVAHRLRAHFLACNHEMLKAGTPIGLCLNRGLGLAIGMLGILKAGGAYLPLDPNYPAERLNYMLNDSDVQCVVAEEATYAQIAEVLPQACKAVMLDTLLSDAVDACDANLVLMTQGNDLAYIIYTSGSTGKPKGVMIEHHSLVNFVCGYKKIAKLNAKSRALGFSTINFDAAIIDFCVSLSAGAGIWIVPEAMRKDVNALTDFIEINGVTHAILPPAVLSLMPKKVLPNLAVLTTGGESCAKDVMDAWAVGRTLINAYGPTEGTVCASYSVYNIAHHHTQIGHFLPNVHGYVLDPHLQLAPIGVAGELYIGGEGLARGYVNQENLTAERFIMNPFATAAEKAKGENRRLYKTGDLVRWLPEGELEFLGRTDSQVKIRGLRIELGEIETQLGQHPDIDQCVVMVQEQEGQKMIVAYFTSLIENVELGILRQHLAQSLPDYMIPACFMQMQALPLTANGKVDRKKLLTMNPHLSIARGSRVPRDVIELQLQSIWQKILQHDGISIDDNFFHTGGHSLLVIRLVAEIEKAFHMTYPVSFIFANPSIKAQANFIRRKEAVVQYQPLLTFNRNGRKIPLFLVHPGGGGAAAYVELAAAMDKEQPLHAIESYNLYSGERMIESIQGLAEQYVTYIRSVQAQGPYYLGGWSFGGVVAFEIARQLVEQGEIVRNVFLLDSVIFHSHSNMDVSQFERIIGAELAHDEWYQTLPEHYAQRIVDVTRSGSTATLQYQIDQPYTGPVMLFKAAILPNAAASDTETTEGMQGQELLAEVLSSSDNGWGQVVDNLTIMNVEVTHKDMVKGDNAKLMASLIEQELDR